MCLYISLFVDVPFPTDILTNACSSVLYTWVIAWSTLSKNCGIITHFEKSPKVFLFSKYNPTDSPTVPLLTIIYKCLFIVNALSNAKVANSASLHERRTMMCFTFPLW